jgi:hypothetical protein
MDGLVEDTLRDRRTNLILRGLSRSGISRLRSTYSTPSFTLGESIVQSALIR